MRRRKLVCASSFVLATLVATIGVAWACTEFTSLAAPKSSPALAEVQVKGTGQVKPKDAAKQVEIRWNDVNGPLLATATAQEISDGVKAVVPNAPPGIYFLVAVNDGKGIARTSIEVTSPAGTGAPVDFRPLTPAASQLAGTSSGNSSQLAGMALLAGGLIVLFGGALAGLSLQSRKARALAAPAGHDDLSA